MNTMSSPKPSEFFAASLLKPSVEAPSAPLGRSEKTTTRRTGPSSRLSKLAPLAFARYPDRIFHWCHRHCGLADLRRRGQRDDRAGRLFCRSAAVSMLWGLISTRCGKSIDRVATSIATSQEQMTRSVDQLAAGQEQMTREITKLAGGRAVRPL